MAEEFGKRARLGDDVAESIVGVLGDGVAAGVEVASDVAIVVVTWNIKLLSGGVRSGGVGDGEVEQPADTTSSLQCAGEVFTPVVMNR